MQILASLALGQHLPRPLHKLERALAGVAWEDLGWSAGILIVAALVGRLLAWGTLRGLKRWAAHADAHVAVTVERQLQRPLGWLLPFGCVLLALPLLELPKVLSASLQHGVILGSIVLFGWFVFRVLMVLEEVIGRQHDAEGKENRRARALKTQVRTLRNIAGFAVFVITTGGALMTFDGVRQFGASLLASAGVAGIIVGFAAQKTLGALVGGIQIAFSQQIRVDDLVMLDTEGGTIEEITLTYVVIRTWDLRRLIVPINYFLEKPFQNWTRSSPEMIGTVLLRLDFGAPIAALRTEFERLLHGNAKWDTKTGRMQVTDSDDKTLVLRFVMSAVDSGTLWDLRCEIREQLLAFTQQHHPSALPRARAESVVSDTAKSGSAS